MSKIPTRHRRTRNLSSRLSTTAFHKASTLSTHSHLSSRRFANAVRALRLHYAVNTCPSSTFDIDYLRCQDVFEQICEADIAKEWYPQEPVVVQD